jgi:hypothetical protein
MWQLINNLINNKPRNELENNYFKELEKIENFIGYIVESSIEKNLNSDNYILDDISDMESYDILINLELMLKKYLFENQKILSFNIGILSKFNKNRNINYTKELINSNFIKCLIDEMILYFSNNNYCNIMLLEKIIEFYKRSNIIFDNISSYDNSLINNFIYINDLKEEIYKNKNNFEKILKKIFYGLIKNNKFTKSSFYNLMMIKLINKMINNLNEELKNNKNKKYSDNNSKYIIDGIENLENFEYSNKIEIIQQIV